MTCKASLILRHIEGIACHTRNVKTKYVPYLQKVCTYVEFLHTRNAYPIAGHLDPSVVTLFLLQKQIVDCAPSLQWNCMLDGDLNNEQDYVEEMVWVYFVPHIFW